MKILFQTIIINQILQAKKSKENDEFAAALAEAGVVLAEDYVEDKKVCAKNDKSSIYSWLM